MGVLSACKPRKDVLKGDLNDAIFAADFGDLVAGNAPPVYADARTFFQNTHPAKQLCKVVEAVFGRLANPKESGATIRLSTGFGGGKTHTLMGLWHLAHHIDDPAMGTDLLPAAGRPKSVTVAALDASKAGNPVFARHGKTTVKSLWGELAYGLGGEKALKALGDADDAERQPDEALLEKLFPPGPVLLLLDEVVVYMATLSDRGQGNLLAFLNKLSAVVGKRPQTVLVVTDPADQRAYAKEASKVGDTLARASAAAKLDDLLGRRVTDFDPIGDESARVIVRRLFEDVDPAEAHRVSADAPTFRAGEVERVFVRRGQALVTSAFQFRAPAGGAAIPLPGSAEFALVVAGRGKPLTALDLTSADPRREGDALLVDYARKGEPLRVTVRHEPGPTPFTLRKRLEIENCGDAPVTIDEIHLESFLADPKPDAGGRGQPFMIGGRRFLGVEHPIAEQAVVDGRAVERHFPAVTIPPGGRLISKTAVAGLAPAEQAEARFEEYATATAHRREDFFWVYNTWAAHDHLGVDRVDGKQIWLDEPLLKRLVDAFHVAIDPAWKGKAVEIVVLSAERRKEERIEANVYVLDEEPPKP